MEVFSKKELIIMVAIVVILLIVITYFTVKDIKEYLENRKVKKIGIIEEEEFKVECDAPVSSMVQVLEEEPFILEETVEEIEPLVIESKKTEPTFIEKEVIAEEVHINDFVDEKEKAISELARVTHELEQEENTLEDTITHFELEQEENAIISLDELSKLSNDLYNVNEFKQYDDGDEPITIDEVINKFNNIVEEKKEIKENPIMDDIKPIYKKKESIPFISCIYGLEKNNEGLEFENTASYEKLEKEIQKTNEFLDNLKEIQEKHEN